MSDVLEVSLSPIRHARYSPRWFSIIVETSPLSFPFIASQADILALWGQSKILGHCWDVLNVVTSVFRFGSVARLTDSGITESRIS